MTIIALTRRTYQVNNKSTSNTAKKAKQGIKMALGISLFAATLIFLATATVAIREDEKTSQVQTRIGAENGTSSSLSSASNEMTDSRNPFEVITTKPLKRLRGRRVKLRHFIEKAEEDNEFSGSRYSERKWSVPSDGWIAVPNPTLRIASESGRVSRTGQKAEALTMPSVAQVKQLPLPPLNNLLEQFLLRTYSDQEVKSLAYLEMSSDVVNPTRTWRPAEEASISSSARAEHDDVDWWSSSNIVDEEIRFCSSEEMFAPTCFNENRRSGFFGCVDDERYPYRDIYKALMRDDLISQKLAKEDTYPTDAGSSMSAGSGGIFDNDQVDYPGFVCPSNVELARPRRLLNVERQWRVIVNDGRNFQQTVRLETCSKALAPCRLMAPCFGSICVQKYAYHRLLSYDPCQPEKGLFIDIYRLPIACSCAIHQK